MVADKIEYIRLEQKSFYKSLVAEKCKAYEIYRIICDVHKEACFSQKYLQMSKIVWRMLK